MSRFRYAIRHERIGKWMLEDLVESLGRLDSEEAMRVTITDRATGKQVSAAGADYDDALERACRKLGISSGDLELEM